MCSMRCGPSAIRVDGRRRAAPAEPADAVVATTLPTGKSCARIAAIAQPLVVRARVRRSPISSRSRRSRRSRAVPRRFARRDRHAGVAGANLGTADTRRRGCGAGGAAHCLGARSGAGRGARCWPSVVSHQSSVKHHRRSLSKLIGSDCLSRWHKGSREREGFGRGADKRSGTAEGQIGRSTCGRRFACRCRAPIGRSGVQRLSGVSIRGRRVTARPDRG